MRFVLSHEQEEYRRQVRKYFEATSSVSQVRLHMDSADGFDRAMWLRMAEQLGIQGIAVPEEYGGSGQTSVELGVVMHEAGRALTCTPLFASAGLAANALLCAGDRDAMARWLPAIVSGEVVATLAVCTLEGSWSLLEPGVTARRGDRGFLLTGGKGFVLHGHVADLVLVTALTDGKLSLFAVDGQAPGLTRARLPTLDPTRSQARLDFSDTPAELIGVEGEALSGLETALHLALITLAQEQVGAAQRCLDMAIGYAKSREQFGRPIGSFQAIKHICADLLVEIESARAAADYAAWAAANHPDELPVLASLVKAFCSEAFLSAAAQNIQIHGGIGFTWEHDAHLFFKRAASMAEYLGSPVAHRERLAGLVLAGYERAN